MWVRKSIITIFNQSAGNATEQWKIINSSVDCKDKRKVCKIRDSDSELIEGSQVIANLFYQYFVNAPLDLVADPPDHDPHALEHCTHSQSHTQSLFLTPLTEIEISSHKNSQQ